LSTKEACQRLKISEATIYIRIKEGRLHPVKQNGANLFHIDEIVAEEQRLAELYRTRAAPSGRRGASVPLPPATRHAQPPPPPRAPAPSPAKLPEYNGENASAAFDLFDQGKSQRDAVKTLKLTCEVVEHLYDKWKAFGTEWQLSAQALAQARKRLEWWEEPPTARGFIAAMNHTIQREIEKALSEQPAPPLEEVDLPSPSAAPPPAAATPAPSPDPVTPPEPAGPQPPAAAAPATETPAPQPQAKAAHRQVVVETPLSQAEQDALNQLETEGKAE
jgi:transposase